MDAPAEPVPAADSALIARACEGDEAAFGELMQRHYEPVFRTVLAIVRNEHDARDLCQEVWIKVWRQLPTFRAEARFTTWLHPIAVRRALDHLRKRRRWFDRFLSFQREDEEGRAAAAFEPVDESPAASGLLEQQERRERFEAAIDSLPPKHRAVLALRELQGLSYDEIASAVGCRRGTVMSRLFHARRLLVQHLRDASCD